MDIQEFIDRINILSNKSKFSSMFGKEIMNMFSSILYYLALEQIPDTTQARKMFIRALNMLHSPLATKIEHEFYDIWGNFPERKDNLGSFTLNKYDLGFIFETSDIGVISQNSSEYDTPRVEPILGVHTEEQAHLIRLRSSKYKGILGNGYKKFYYDYIMYYAQGTLSGVTPNMLPYTQKYKDAYIEKIKAYLTGR